MIEDIYTTFQPDTNPTLLRRYIDHELNILKDGGWEITRVQRNVTYQDPYYRVRLHIETKEPPKRHKAQGVRAPKGTQAIIKARMAESQAPKSGTSSKENTP